MLGAVLGAFMGARRVRTLGAGRAALSAVLGPILGASLGAMAGGPLGRMLGGRLGAVVCLTILTLATTAAGMWLAERRR